MNHSDFTFFCSMGYVSGLTWAFLSDDVGDVMPVDDALSFVAHVSDLLVISVQIFLGTVELLQMFIVLLQMRNNMKTA